MTGSSLSLKSSNPCSKDNIMEGVLATPVSVLAVTNAPSGWLPSSMVNSTQGLPATVQVQWLRVDWSCKVGNGKESK